LVGELEEQCRHLRHYYCPVSMRQVIASVKAGSRLPSNAVTVTVDDGYRDFLLYAAPVFRAFDIPATVFVATGFLDGEMLWWDSIEFALRQASCREVRVDGWVYPVVTPEQRTAALESIGVHAKTLPNRARMQLIGDLVRELGVRLPETPPADYAPLRWDEVRRLSREGFEFGSHSVSHPVLSRLETPEELDREIQLSRQRLQEELGEPPAHFCYPNGQPEDWNETVVNAVSRSGFATACTTIHGVNRRIDSPFRLARLSVNLTFTPEYFAERLAGIH